ncbi:Septin-10, partial [Galemys pyrenaicus]
EKFGIGKKSMPNDTVFNTNGEDQSYKHVCLYFMSPTDHSLKTLDLFNIKNLDSEVNIIPMTAQTYKIFKKYTSSHNMIKLAKTNASVINMDEVKVENKRVKAYQYLGVLYKWKMKATMT